jgi:hypothetical protein
MNWIAVLNLTPMVIGMMITLYLLIKHTQLMIPKWDAVRDFTVFLLIAIVIRHAITGQNPSIPNIDPFWFTLVFWEDAFHMVPFYFAFKKWGINKYTKAFAAVLIIFFAAGHYYHGILGMLVTATYPVIMYWTAKKYNIGTSMICHIIFDLMLYHSVRILNL